MRKLLPLLILLAQFQSCNQAPVSPDCSADPTAAECSSVDDPTIEKLDGVADAELALNFESNVTFINATAAQEEKFRAALEVIKQVVASDEFRDRILNYTYQGKKTFVDNEGKTTAEIYRMILVGAETLQPSEDNEMDLEVELYYASNSTVGYTYPNTKRIWVNTKFFDSYDTAGVARNLFHEWLHKIGFGHASSYSVSRDYSVPYAIGDIINDLGRKYR